MMPSVSASPLLAALLAAFSFSAGALAIEAEGSAATDAGLVAAREMAIQDALRQAALAQGARIESGQIMTSGFVAESSSVTAAPLSGKVRVLDERVQNDLYQVRIAVDPSPARDACAGGRTLRRRVITTFVAVDRPQEAPDLGHLSTVLAEEMARRLSGHPGLRADSAAAVSVMPDQRIADPVAGADNAQLMAAREDAQFIVGGRVISSAVTARSPRFGLFGSDKTSEQGITLTAPLLHMTGANVRLRPSARQFDAEFWVYDGLTGVVLTRQRVSRLASGDVMPSMAPPFGSAMFWQSDYGKVVDAALNEAQQRLADVIGCLPYAARIARVEGKQVFINAGGVDALQVGDRLLLYKQGRALQSAGNVRQLGLPETLSGDVLITQVQPGLAIGVVQGARKPVEAGDIVRYVPRR